MSKEAMKLALDALEKLVRFESDSWELGSCRIAGQATKALREALAEQPVQQEPVTWRNAALRVGEDLCSVGPFGYYDMTAEQWLDWALSVVTVHAPPRTQPPAQRKPLTDEEINELRQQFGVSSDGRGIKEFTYVRDFARAIEASHGIKGNT